MSVQAESVSIETLLSRVPLFSGLTPEELARFARGSREMSAAKGDILFHRGDACTGFHLIVTGQVKIAFTSAQGSEKVIEILGPGQTFGEAIMFMDKPYMVFAQTLADSHLVHLSKSTVYQELERHPIFARKMIASLSVRLHHLVSDVESYSLHSGRQRIIGYLLRDLPDTADGAGELAVILPTSKGTIASRLNLTQEHFSRILHDLADEGLIRVERRTIHIPDIKRLIAYED
ncbi:MAG: Crp/Fnr family transcriptional regulator [Betaproteobacteria bacterium]